MSNKCENIFILRCNELAQIQRAVKAYNENRLLSEFIPEPNTVDPSETSENWREENWGMGFDVGRDDYESSIIISENGTQITFFFISNWEPPLKAMKAFEEAGFSLELYYWDHDQLSGQYITDDDYDYCSVVGYFIKVREIYPDRFNAVFGIS